MRNPATTDRRAPCSEATDGPLAIVNVSALVGRGLDQTVEYRAVIDHLLDTGYRVVLLPHVSRPNSDDIASCERVYDAVSEGRTDSSRLLLVLHLLPPATIRGLTALADLVVTGRMHLAIMALGNGVPAITLATQGKVEGLMQLIGIPQLCVEPREGMAARVIEVIEMVRSDASVAARLKDELPRIRTLARRNLDGLATESAQNAAVALPAA